LAALVVICSGLSLVASRTFADFFCPDVLPAGAGLPAADAFVAGAAFFGVAFVAGADFFGAAFVVGAASFDSAFAFVFAAAGFALVPFAVVLAKPASHRSNTAVSPPGRRVPVLGRVRAHFV
jgi:hypothetical protein